MNISRVISALSLQYGLYNITLPFKDADTGKTKPTDQVLKEVLSTITVPLYSQFVPWKREGTIHIKDMKRVPGHENVYFLPSWLTYTEVQYVIDIHLPYYNVRGTYGDIAPAYGINRSMQGVATSKAYMMAASQMRSEPTWDYLGHNQVKLYGWPKTNIEIEVACDHMDNLESIEAGCYDSFMELAQQDVKMFLYNTLKYHNELATAFGNINIKIEDFQAAEAERNAMLDRWRDTYHVDISPFSFM